MRVQLRPFHTDEKLASIYPTPHHHSGWPDHRQRVRSTIALAGWFDNCQSVADLSCGDGTIIDALDIPVKYKGDYAPGYDLCGSIDETIDLIPKVDLFILSETIEHLVDPDATLAKIRAKTRYLVLSTPNGEDNAGNVEHYWGWDDKEIRGMLHSAGFIPVVYSSLEFADAGYVYDYQLWGCQ